MFICLFLQVEVRLTYLVFVSAGLQEEPVGAVGSDVQSDRGGFPQHQVTADTFGQELQEGGNSQRKVFTFFGEQLFSSRDQVQLQALRLSCQRLIHV